MKTQTKLLLAFVFMLTVMYSLSSPIFAQAVLQLTVYPAIQEKEVKAGETTRLQVQFRNSSDNAVNGTINVANYIVVDKKGTPRIIDDARADVKYAAGSWITPAANAVAIPANDFITVDLNIKVPNEVPSCGAYAMVYFQPEAGTVLSQGTGRETGVGMTPRIGSLINFTVQNKRCNILARISNVQLPEFVEHGPISAKFDIFNGGDVHIAPRTLVNVSNMFGKYAFRETAEEKRIFPETSKAYDVKFGEKWMFGRYKVDVVASYDNNQRATQSAYIWVLPWKEISVLVLALIIAGLLINNMIKKSRGHAEKMEEALAEEKEEIEKLKAELRNKE
ncbi:MAG TPA: hypothetical protein VK338_01195 [Candidatus Nitrosocosmicus sp.]|nr:hypothetical protein [Candidatus Nitrosocosmicus sp.]